MSIRTKLNETAGKMPYVGKALTYPISKSEITDKILEISLYPLKLPSEDQSKEEQLETGLKTGKAVRNAVGYMGAGMSATGLISLVGSENASLDSNLFAITSVYCGALLLNMAYIFQKEVKRMKISLEEYHALNKIK
ncbi:hypothetical protein COV19_02430 [Candidatus Woesearchaeota archaeon CG10_big_fil_rev_8_21_14_0_10_44_13]|nr:MAG: hypothetical protein COV19_02430 [Candidatus Woesearchaeota archaeon CG10_big_fil_rev_8_21_14_0_10_44_13]